MRAAGTKLMALLVAGLVLGSFCVRDVAARSEVTKMSRRPVVVQPTFGLHRHIQEYLGGVVSPHTLRAKQSDLALFAAYVLQATGGTTLAHITSMVVAGFLKSREAEGDSPGTRKRRLATVKHFLRVTCEAEGVRNPASQVRGPKTQPLKFQGLSPEQQSALLAHVEGDSARNEFLVKLLLYTGLRREEAARLSMNQLDAEERRLVDVWRKCDRYQNIHLPTALLPSLCRYLPQRLQTIAQHDPVHSTLRPAKQGAYPLLVSTWGVKPGVPASWRLSTECIMRVVRTACVACGIPQQHAHPHILRHTFAHNLLTRTNNIRLVSQALGHSGLDITMVYTQTAEDELAEALDKL